MKEVTCEDWIQNPTPRLMWVWDSNENNKLQRKVIYFNELDIMYPIFALSADMRSTEKFKCCAEIEKSVTRQMTNKELSRWLREKPTREYKYNNCIVCPVYSSHTYDEDCGDKEVYENVLIREDDGEWKEPLIEEME